MSTANQGTDEDKPGSLAGATLMDDDDGLMEWVYDAESKSLKKMLDDSF
jgi:hypothetical protein